jgi:hypothetical protein
LKRKNNITLPKDPLNALVLGYVRCWFLNPNNNSIYPSDISMELGLDYEKVLKAVEYLVKHGILKSRVVRV